MGAGLSRIHVLYCLIEMREQSRRMCVEHEVASGVSKLRDMTNLKWLWVAGDLLSFFLINFNRIFLLKERVETKLIGLETSYNVCVF